MSRAGCRWVPVFHNSPSSVPGTLASGRLNPVDWLVVSHRGPTATRFCASGHLILDLHWRQRREVRVIEVVSQWHALAPCTLLRDLALEALYELGVVFVGPVPPRLEVH